MGRRRSHLLPGLCAALAALATGATAQSPAARAIPALPDSMRQRITSEVTIPPGFELSIYATPPALTYPVCVEPGGPGILFVCTDPNLNLDRELKRGRILRFVDEDGDGRADRYTVFADSLDNVRGLIADGETLYAMHAPTLVALRDSDGDGVADEERVLVRGLGFPIGDRGGDHTSNGITLGIDGWIYIAMGDYGFLGATGSDGTQLRMHGGGVVRVRPDGTELEIVARGTRNIYDLGIDPSLRIFARDNTNNGQGWNSRLHYLPTGVDAGYPALFYNFPTETHAPLTDYGAGAATAALWIDEPHFPAGVAGTLFTADWALNRIYRHTLTPRGATFDVSQAEFMEIPRPAHMEVDPASNLIIASLSGGSYTYAGEDVGFVARLRPAGAPAAPPPPEDVSAAELVARIVGPSAVLRLEAQRELLRRGGGPEIVRALEDAMFSGEHPLGARVAALFTLKQLGGATSHPTLQRAAETPELRAMALRALVDRRGELAGVPTSLFERALDDADPFVRLQAVTGLARIGSSAVRPPLFRAAVDSDTVIAHVARNALAGMAAADVALAALDGGTDGEREAALYILGRLHLPAVVSELIDRVERERRPERRRALLAAVARLHHREAAWNGEWWNNQPNREGPYFAPVSWEESVRSRPLLVKSIIEADGETRDSLLATYVREGVVPRASEGVLRWLAGRGAPGDSALLDRLVGGRDLRPRALEALATLVASEHDLQAAATAMLAAEPVPSGGSAEMLRLAAMDRSFPAELRTQALAALGRIPGREALPTVIAAHATVTDGVENTASLLQAWRRFAGDRRRIGEIEDFAALATGGEEGERILGYAVLVQIAGTSRNPEPARTRAAAVVDAAWSETSSAPRLVKALTLLGVEERYADRIAAYRAGTP